ncbi:MAG: TolC family protein [Planctomycetota bacterium]
MNKTSRISTTSLCAAAISLTICTGISALLSGCLSPEAKAEIEREKNSYADSDVPGEKSPQLTEKLDLEKAKAFAFKHNLQNAVRRREKEIKQELTRNAWLKMLPEMKLNIDKTKRNQTSASRSVGMESGVESLKYSYSSESSNRVYSLKTAWNVIDYGVSWAQAKQAQKQEEITRLAYKRALQNLSLDVTRSYWRNLANSSAAIESVELQKLAADRNSRIENLLKENTIPREDGLNIHKSILSSIKRLKSYKIEVSKARTEFNSLLGLTPGAKVSFSDVEVPYITDYERYEVKKLEQEALLKRPELIQEDYEELISRDAVKIAVLKLFPSPSFAIDHNWDQNPHLYANYWYVVGMKAVSELLALPQRFSERYQKRLEVELAKQRRMALAVSVVAQVRLSLIRYHAAAVKCLTAAEISQVQNDLLRVTSIQVKRGKARATDLVNARTEAFFAKVEYLLAYADMMTMKEQLRNSVGRDPFDKDPESLKKKEFQHTVTDDVVVANAVSLPDIAKQLEYSEFKDAVKAKNKLLSAGEEGAAAALEILNSSDQRARLMAILVVREKGSKKMVASLLPALEDSNPKIRYHASLALRSAFGKNFGYYHEAVEQQREKAVKRWREYLFGTEN